jgi:outer membrane lipoprotein carrier protein
MTRFRGHFCAVLLAVSTLVCGAARAQAGATEETTVDNGYVLLEKFFNGLNTLQGSFTQTVRDSRGQVSDTSKGNLQIRKPGKFRWDYAAPNAQTIVSDGTRIWLYDPELEQVTIRRADASLNGTPAMLLTGQVNVRDTFEIETVERREGLAIINLVPKRSDTDFKRVQLALRGESLTAMSLTDKLGQSTLLQFSQFKRNVSLNDALFKFSVPKGVDVVDNTGGRP